MRDRPTLAAPEGPRFEDEVVDSAWAADQARDTARVMRAALASAQLTGVARAGEVECRSINCRFVLEVTEPDRMGDALAALENDAGLRRGAEQMYLSNLTPTSVTVTLRYAPRPDSETITPD